MNKQEVITIIVEANNYQEALKRASRCVLINDEDIIGVEIEEVEEEVE